MLHIYLIRHGESVANAKQIKQNKVDYPLSESGIFQAKSITLEDDPDIIFTSPQIRALETAQIVCDKYHTKIETDARLIEWQVFPELQNYKLTPQNKRAINPYILQKELNESYGTGESFFDIHTRMNEFVCENINESTYSNIVIISHAAAINHLIHILLFGYDLNAQKHFDFFLKHEHIHNCGVTKITRKHGIAKLEYFNKTPQI